MDTIFRSYIVRRGNERSYQTQLTLCSRKTLIGDHETIIRVIRNGLQMYGWNGTAFEDSDIYPSYAL